MRLPRVSCLVSFKLYDRDGDGHICKEELFQMLVHSQSQSIEPYYHQHRVFARVSVR